jgi:hypothetical protein
MIVGEARRFDMVVVDLNVSFYEFFKLPLK